MVEHVTQRTFHILAGTEDTELLGHRLELPGIAAQAEEGRVEPGHEGLQAFGAVAFRVEADEQHLHPPGVVAQGLHDRRQAGQRARADIRAGGVAEEEDDDLAAKIGQRAPLPVMIAERQLAPESGAGQVGVAEGRGFPTAGRQQGTG